MEYLVFFGTIDAYILCCAEIANLRIERGKFGYLDEGSEAFLLNNLIGDGILIVSGLLGKDSSSCVETVNALLLQGLRAQVFEQKIMFGKTI